jgi:hypothetical protein
MDHLSISGLLGSARSALQYKVSLRFLLLCIVIVLTPEAYRWMKPAYQKMLNPAGQASEGLGVQDLITEVKNELQRAAACPDQSA